MSSKHHNRGGKFLHRNIRLVTALVILAVLVVFEFIQHIFLINLPRGLWITSESLLLLIAGVTVFALVDRIYQRRKDIDSLSQELRAAQVQVLAAEQRQNAILRISQAFSEVRSEREAMELTLRLAKESTGAAATSFVPLDERAQPMPALSSGDIPFQLSDAWLEHLASPQVRAACSTCQRFGQPTEECILVPGMVRDALGIYCLPVKRGEQEYGVLNLYLPRPVQLDQHSQAMLRKITDEASLALQGMRLRNRELATLRQINTARKKADLGVLLQELADDLRDTLEADFVIAQVLPSRSEKDLKEVTAGELPDNNRPLLDGILHSVIASCEAVSLGEVTGDAENPPRVRALLAVPLIAHDETGLGALMVGSRRTRAFTQRHLAVLQTLASQVSLVVQNVNLLAELEYKTVMDERTRLAREIHDGLAQALGFLKLKISQMKNYLEFSDYERLKDTIQASLDTVSEMYLETRDAIDGLRIGTREAHLSGWLNQSLEEFREKQNLIVHVEDNLSQVELPPEIQMQLIRVVQEALSNIRKHARATQVWVACQQMENDLILEVRDDGVGFDVDDIPSPSQHGLQGMRERAELIGADFQVISIPWQGTAVRISLPLTQGERKQ
jgi:two-component system nitrate/nitrite sensor histidine kinase NarX